MTEEEKIEELKPLEVKIIEDKPDEHPEWEETPEEGSYEPTEQEIKEMTDAQ